ncbi:MAG: type IX secretion system protein PorQ [Dysgonamonadaceae bacterium]|nr:type IX secretion system protein PorQ [Dysgonamonadaceae bacterium]
MRIILILSILVVSLFPASAQDGNSAFTYLLLPGSARAAALGGTNISIVEDDLSLIYQNPGFLGQEMDRTLNANYLSYVGGIKLGSAAFAKALGKRSAWGVGVNFSNYGEMLETTVNDEQIGDLNVSDICGNIFFSRDLSEMIRGGVTAKFIYSNYRYNTAIGLGVDLGISYYNPDKDISIGLVGKNLGRQIKAYEEELLDLPWDIQLGFSQKLGHAPIRYSVTAVHLNQWKFYDLHQEKGDSFTRTFLKHFIFGVEFLPVENFWVATGYNVKRGADMAISDGGNKWGAFSVGAGLKVKAFDVGCSVAKYHPAATSFMVSLSISLAEKKL